MVSVHTPSMMYCVTITHREHVHLADNSPHRCLSTLPLSMTRFRVMCKVSV